MQKDIVLFIFVIFVSISYGANWKDCGSTEGTIQSVTISNCPGSGVCNLVLGTNVTFEVDFQTKEVVKTATAVVHGIISGIPVPFHIDDPNACSGCCSLTCPMASGSKQTYKTSLSVKSYYPKVSVIVKWELKDENSNDVFCLVVQAKIVDSSYVRHKKKDNTLRYVPHA